jgi:hypothetical protein
MWSNIHAACEIRTHDPIDHKTHALHPSATDRFDDDVLTKCWSGTVKGKFTEVTHPPITSSFLRSWANLTFVAPKLQKITI